MKKVLKTKKQLLVGFGVLVGLLGGVWFVVHNEPAIDDALIDIVGLSDEEMEEYFDSYAEMTADGEQENILIVVSDVHPESYGAKEVVKGPNHTYYLMYDTAEKRDVAYEHFAEDDTVSAEKNIKMELLNYMSWGIERMGINDGMVARGDGGEDVKVAIIDTGLDVSLFQQYYPSRGLSVYNVDTDSDEFAGMEDTVGHGTHIAGTIAEGTTEQTSMMAIKADKDKELFVANVNVAIYKAMEAGADVINMSFGGSGYSRSLKLALDAANEVGIVTVAAAGNDNSAELFYPAGFDNTISVAALDWNLERAVWDEEENSGSNYNAMVDYAAPGTVIRSINGLASGTSVAAPHVSAVVALLKSYNKDLGLNEVNELLRKHVLDLGDEGRDDYYGYGMIDLNDAEFCGDAYCDEYGVFAMDASIEDLTRGGAKIAVLDDGLLITADKACMVIISNDGGESYNVVPAAMVSSEENMFKFEFEIDDEVEAKVVLKGDVDMGGSVNARDSAKIDYYLLSVDNPNHRELSTLELLIADLNNSGTVTARDESLLNYALSSQNNPNYRPLEW